MEDEKIADAVMDATRTLTMQEAMKRFDKSRTAFYNYMNDGLPASRKKGRIYFSVTEVEDFLKQRGAAAASFPRSPLQVTSDVYDKLKNRCKRYFGRCVSKMLDEGLKSIPDEIPVADTSDTHLIRINKNTHKALSHAAVDLERTIFDIANAIFSRQL